MKRIILIIATVLTAVSCSNSATTPIADADSIAVADSSITATDTTVAKIAGSENSIK